MKNYKKIIAVLFATAAILTTGCTNTNTDGTTNTDGATNTNTDGTTQTKVGLTETEARQIALNKAGLETATFTKQKYDSYDSEYEFEFYVGDKEYECEISAIDGTIKEYDIDFINQ